MFLFELLLSAIIALIILFGVMNEYYSRKLHVPAMPTMPWAHRSLISLIRNNIEENKNYSVAELGCGWGGLLSILSKSFRNIRIDGYELVPIPYGVSLCRSVFLKNCRVYRRDFFSTDLSNYNIFICYLSPKLMPQLYDKLKHECSGESILISFNFEVPDIEPVEVISIGSIVPVKIFLYRLS